MSPFDKLQSIQRDKVEQLLLTSEYWGPGVSGDVWGIEVYTSRAGIFWKNPLICSDVDLMVQIIMELHYDNWLLLLPHLGEWVLAHSRPVSGQVSGDRLWRDELAEIVDGEVRRRDKWVVIQPGNYGVPFYDVDWPSGAEPAIRTASGLYKGSRHMLWRDSEEWKNYGEGYPPMGENQYTLRQLNMNKELVENFAVVHDIDNSEPESWWVFARFPMEFVIVDYVGKRMWGTQTRPVMCYWGDDIWDPTSWKLGSEGRKFGIFWLLGLGDYEERDGEPSGQVGDAIE